MHQGDQDGIKGVYHINAVDEVTQYEVVLSCERISEQFLLPILTEMLEAFPFNISGFHADNGSEYINLCYFPTIITDDKGKQRKKYHYGKMMTSYEKLKSLDNAKDFLKKGLSFEQLDKVAYRISDNKSADQLNFAKKRLFKHINEQKKPDY